MTSKTCQIGIAQVEPWYFPWWRHWNSCCLLRHVPFLICEREKRTDCDNFIPTHIFLEENDCRLVSLCYSRSFDLPNRKKTHVADTLDSRYLLKMSSFSLLRSLFFMTSNSFLHPTPSEKRRSLGDIAKETTVSPARTKMKNAFPGNLRMTCLVCNDKSWCKSIFFV